MANVDTNTSSLIQIKMFLKLTSLKHSNCFYIKILAIFGGRVLQQTVGIPMGIKEKRMHLLYFIIVFDI